MPDDLIFPQVSGLNWPSNLLHVWLRLHELGVPSENIRFLPEPGHFSQPEVMLEPFSEDPDQEAGDIELRHPTEPDYQPDTGRLLVRGMDPATVRPRFKVHVRSEILMRFYTDAQGHERIHEQVVGRLAEFMEPMIAGLPDAPAAAAADHVQKPLALLTSQVCAQYPELMVVLQANLRDVLARIAEAMHLALKATDLATLQNDVRLAIEGFYQGERLAPMSINLAPGVTTADARGSADPQACREAFLTMAEKVRLPEQEMLRNEDLRVTLARFRRWAGTIFQPDPQARNGEIEELFYGLDLREADRQRLLFESMKSELSYENVRARRSVVRELLEIVTTEAFTASVATDYMWGLGYIHGNISDLDMNVRSVRHDGLLLSMTGGLGHRALLQALMRRWAREGAFLGVGRPEEQRYVETVAGRERLDAGVLDEGAQAELWALVAWRRDTPDPLVLLETAARRLVHPEVSVNLRRYLPAPSRFSELGAQPQKAGGLGGTAVLGGKAMLQYPGVIIQVPMAENADAEAIKAKSVLLLLIRLFLPVCFHVEVIWQEAVARLGQGAYIRHDFQQGVRLTDPWTSPKGADEMTGYDPPTL